jgi:hypothetical protein
LSQHRQMKVGSLSVFVCASFEFPSSCCLMFLVMWNSTPYCIKCRNISTTVNVYMCFFNPWSLKSFKYLSWHEKESQFLM